MAVQPYQNLILHYYEFVHRLPFRSVVLLTESTVYIYFSERFLKSRKQFVLRLHTYAAASRTNWTDTYRTNQSNLTTVLYSHQLSKSF